MAGSPEATVVTNGTRVLSVGQSGESYALTGAGRASAPPGTRVSDALLDDRWAVVVAQDQQQRRPERATVRDLASGATWTLDGSSDLPTATGGGWALAGDTLVYPTVHRGAFCVASVDLTTRRATPGWCAPARHGWNAPILSDQGLSILAFDDHRPSCRTLRFAGGTDPFADATRCAATSGAVLRGGAVWLEVPNEHRYEAGVVRATTAGGLRDLGPADTGSLVVCGGDAYWAVDAGAGRARAELRRWDGTRVATVYRSKPGQAFMGTPACAGSVLTVSSFSTSGDELVSASVG